MITAQEDFGFILLKEDMNIWLVIRGVNYAFKQLFLPPTQHCLSVEILLSTHPIQYGIPCPGAMVIGWLRVSAPSVLVVASKVDRLDVVVYISCHCGEFTTWKSQVWEKLWFAQCHLSLMSHMTGKPQSQS